MEIISGATEKFYRFKQFVLSISARASAMIGKAFMALTFIAQGASSNAALVQSKLELRSPVDAASERQPLALRQVGPKVRQASQQQMDDNAEQDAIRRRAGQLIASGDCERAEKLAGKAGDFFLRRDVADHCSNSFVVEARYRSD